MKNAFELFVLLVIDLSKVTLGWKIGMTGEWHGQALERRRVYPGWKRWLVLFQKGSLWWSLEYTTALSSLGKVGEVIYLNQHVYWLSMMHWHFNPNTVIDSII